MALDVITAAKELANAVKKYNDVPLMNQVFELQSALLELQQEKMELRKALDAAESKLRARDKIEKRGQLFYKRDDPEPICPVCWQRDERIVYLPQSQEWNGGIRRDCRVCKEVIWEVPMQR